MTRYDKPKERGIRPIVRRVRSAAASAARVLFLGNDAQL
jgi:hypothetical protein